MRISLEVKGEPKGYAPLLVYLHGITDRVPNAKGNLMQFEWVKNHAIRVPIGVLHDMAAGEVSSGAVAVFLVLRSYADGQGRAVVSNAELATKCHMTQRTVARHLNCLEKADRIMRRRERVGHGLEGKVGRAIWVEPVEESTPVRYPPLHHDIPILLGAN